MSKYFNFDDLIGKDGETLSLLLGINPAISANPAFQLALNPDGDFICSTGNVPTDLNGFSITKAKKDRSKKLLEEPLFFYNEERNILIDVNGSFQITNQDQQLVIRKETKDTFLSFQEMRFYTKDEHLHIATTFRESLQSNGQLSDHLAASISVFDEYGIELSREFVEKEQTLPSKNIKKDSVDYECHRIATKMMLSDILSALQANEKRHILHGWSWFHAKRDPFGLDKVTIDSPKHNLKKQTFYINPQYGFRVMCFPAFQPTQNCLFSPLTIEEIKKEIVNSDGPDQTVIAIGKSFASRGIDISRLRKHM